MVELWFESEPQIDGAMPQGVAERDGGPLPSTAQTWDWEQAGAVLARCTHSLMLVEASGRDDPPHKRIESFAPLLHAALEKTSPAAVWCPNSTRVVRPRELLEDELGPFVNVRMFRDMDTLGLHVFERRVLDLIPA